MVVGIDRAIVAIISVDVLHVTYYIQGIAVVNGDLFLNIPDFSEIIFTKG